MPEAEPAASTPSPQNLPPAVVTEPHVPAGLRTVADWAWRFLVILALLAAVVLLIARLEVLFVALFVSLMVTAMLEPAAAGLRRRGVPRGLATAGVLLAAVASVFVVLYLAGRSLVKQSDQLVAAISAGSTQVLAWAQSTFGISLNQLTDSAGSVGTGSDGSLLSSVFGAASTAFEILGGAGITLFATVFFVLDGAGIWSWVKSLFPPKVRRHVDQAGRLSWQTLTSYAHATVLIAAIDAIGIGVGAALIGVPLAGPIGILVFFGSFVPIVGALASGLVAVLIALATQGLTGALLMGAVVLLVQQLEGHVLQPMSQGRFVAIHPLAIVLAVAGGSIVAGIVGAVIAVPLVAVVNVLVRYAAGTGRPETAEIAAPLPEPVVQ